jgi:hypothetical protein
MYITEAGQVGAVSSAGLGARWDPGTTVGAGGEAPSRSSYKRGSCFVRIWRGRWRPGIRSDGSVPDPEVEEMSQYAWSETDAESRRRLKSLAQQLDSATVELWNVSVLPRGGTALRSALESEPWPGGSATRSDHGSGRRRWRPCFNNRWGVWRCEHNHDGKAGLIDLQEAYEHVEGWTAQSGLWEDLETK